MRVRLGSTVGLVVAAIVLSLLYGPVALAVLAVAVLAVWVGRSYPPLPYAPLRRRLPRLRSREPDSELRRRRAELEWSLRDRHQADQVLRPELARTADALLRGRTERGLADDPAAARELLGPELHDWLTSRGWPPPPADRLELMVRRLEGLR